MLQNNTLEQRKYKGIEILKAIVLNPDNACVLVTISKGGFYLNHKSGGIARKMVIGYHHH